MSPAPTSAPFSFQLRASCCWQCGEPVFGPDGGQAQCARCGQAVALRPRAEFVRPQSTHLGPQNPAFAGQQGKRLGPPPSIAFLWDARGEIPAHRLGEALVAWQGARRRASAMDVGAGEELCMLTRELAAHAEKGRDYARARAEFEAALEAVQLPRHRAELLGLMARMAVRAGDVRAAEAWLSCMEPPQDLEADTELRLTTAVVATARGDFMSVLHALGHSADAIALDRVLRFQAALFRINALERLGRGPEAAQQLRQLLDQGPLARQAVDAVQAQYARLGLCPQTLPAVQAAHEQVARASAGTGQLFMGCLLMGVSVLPLAILSVVTLVTYLSDGTYESLIAIPFTFIFVLAFGLWGVRTFRRGLRERRVFATGVRARARVIGAERTGVSVNDVPEMRIHLEVLLQPPFRTSLRQLVSPAEAHLLTPGTVFYVRVDPRQPDVAVLDR